MSDHPHKPLSSTDVEKMDRSFGPRDEVAPPKDDLKDHVKGDVEFVRYRDGNLWYEVINTGFEFPVPVSDVGNATFLCRDRAMLFMRYIRKHLELKNSGAQK